jgi:hypothetical protein
MNFGRIDRVVVIAGIALAVVVARPTPTVASTNTDAPPNGCAFAIPLLVAGTPAMISGPVPTVGASVDVEVYDSDKRIHEVQVTTTSQTWQTVLLFNSGEAGSWTIRARIDGGPPCESVVTVALPAGVVAPSTPAGGGAQQPQVETAAGPTASDLWGFAAAAFGILVAASWIFLLVVGIATLIGARPLARRGWRSVAGVAAFLGILGGFLVVALLADLMVSFSHFDTGTPPDQQTLLDRGIWAMAAIGSVLGAVAWLRIRAHRSTLGAAA